MPGVRRLVEKGPIRGPKSFCSLGGLIDDVRASRKRLKPDVIVRFRPEADAQPHLTSAKCIIRRKGKKNQRRR